MTVGSARRDALVTEAVARFAEAFGRPPAWITQAPGRVNLIGDHTDYAEGFVLPMAIDRRAVIAAAPAPAAQDGSVLRVAERARGASEARSARGSGAAPADAAGSRLRSTARGDLVRASLRTVDRPMGQWADRLLGVAAAARREGVPVMELDLLLHSDVPIGAGLSSSAAIEVAFCTLLDTLRDAGGASADADGPVVPEGHAAPGSSGSSGSPGSPRSPIATAQRCQTAEHDFAGVPCGIMDPLVSAAAEAGRALLIDCRSLRLDQVPLPPELAILIIETPARRDLAEGAYAERRRSVVDAAERLGVRVLRDLEPDHSDGRDHAQRTIERLPEPLRSRARHVHSENRRVLAAVEALRHGELERFGRLLFESHASLRDDFEVSTPELDRIVEIAASLTGAGVLGARLTGAGFGGAAIVAVRRNRLDEARDRLAGALRAGGVDTPTRRPPIAGPTSSAPPIAAPPSPGAADCERGIAGRIDGIAIREAIPSDGASRLQ